MLITPQIVDGRTVPLLAGTNVAVGAVIHACHSATIDQGLATLNIAGLTRDTLDPVLQYCAEVRCVADNASCDGCKRRTEMLGLETLDQYILYHKEIIVGDGAIRLQGQGTATASTPCAPCSETQCHR